MNSTDESTDGRQRNTEFYVGYFPMPRGLSAYLRTLCAMLYVVVGAAAVLLARFHASPGNAAWNTAQVRQFTGKIEALPYPMLLVPGDRPGETKPMLLVEIGKLGGGQRAAPFAGQTVAVSGWLLERDGRRMLELEPGNATFQASDAPISAISAAQPERRILGPVTLRGEIVDSKCFLGAMKPGHGKTHKECATLCVRGGIPPMLVTTDEAGNRTYYLLASPSGTAMDSDILRFIADPVEVRGTLELLGDLRILRLNSADISRL